MEIPELPGWLVPGRGGAVIAGLLLMFWMSKGNEYLAGAFMVVWALLGPILIAMKWRWPRVGWGTLWVAAAVGGWLLLLFAFQANPPENGFSSAVMLLLGWTYLLPLFGLFRVVNWMLAQIGVPKCGGKLARGTFPFLMGLSASFLVITLFLWTPQSRVEALAIQYVQERKMPPLLGIETTRTWRGWKADVRFEESGNYPIRFTRGGRLMAAGLP